MMDVYQSFTKVPAKKGDLDEKFMFHDHVGGEGVVQRPFPGWRDLSDSQQLGFVRDDLPSKPQ